MNGRLRTAQALIGLGCFVLVASATIHLAAYRGASAAIGASNLEPTGQAAMRAIFLLVAWNWIIIGVFTLCMAFTGSRMRRALVILCGAALLAEALVMLRFLGWFVGTDMMFVAAALILVGGFALAPVGSRAAAFAAREPS